MPTAGPRQLPVKTDCAGTDHAMLLVLFTRPAKVMRNQPSRQCHMRLLQTDYVPYQCRCSPSKPNLFPGSSGSAVQDGRLPSGTRRGAGHGGLAWVRGCRTWSPPIGCRGAGQAFPREDQAWLGFRPTPTTTDGARPLESCATRDRRRLLYNSGVPSFVCRSWAFCDCIA